MLAFDPAAARGRVSEVNTAATNATSSPIVPLTMLCSSALILKPICPGEIIILRQENILASEPRWPAAPGITASGLRPSIFEQLDQIVVIKIGGGMRFGEIVADIRQLETHAVPLRQRVHSIDVAETTIGGESGYGTVRNRERAPLDLLPIRCETAVADHIGRDRAQISD